MRSGLTHERTRDPTRHNSGTCSAACLRCDGDGFLTRSILTHPVAVSSTLFNAVQRCTPCAVGCNAIEWTSDVQMVALTGGRRAQVRQTPQHRACAGVLSSSSSDSSVMAHGTRSSRTGSVRCVSLTSRQWRAPRWPFPTHWKSNT